MALAYSRRLVAFSEAVEWHSPHPACPASVGAAENQICQSLSSIYGLSTIRRGEVGSTGNTDRKSTRLNSSHDQISYAVFCLKKKKKNTPICQNVDMHQAIWTHCNAAAYLASSHRYHLRLSPCPSEGLTARTPKPVRDIVLAS